MSFIPVLLFVIALINIILALFVILRNTRSKMLILFSASAVAVAVWAISDAMLLTVDAPQVTIFWEKIFYIAPMFIPYLFILFAYKYPGDKRIPIWVWTVYLIPVTLLSIPIVFNDHFLLNSVDLSGVLNSLIINEGPFLWYGLYFVISFTVLYLTVFNKLRHSTGIQHAQAKYLFYGVVLGSVPALITNLVLPFMGVSNYIWLGPVFTLMYISSFTYAMRRHNLFDIKSALTRSIAYIMLLVTVAALYAVLVFGASALFFNSEKISLTQQIIFIIAALFMSTTFQPLKKFFDKLTDRIFYRQSYDAEQILTEYSDFLVDEVETEEIISHTLVILNNALNPESVYVMLYREGMGEWYDNTGAVFGETRDDISRALEYQKSSIMVSDLSSIREDEFIRNIKDHLIREGISLSVKLSTHGQLEGFILLGDKKNGSRYSPDDYGFLTTIANELSVSLQNSERFDEIQKFNKTLTEQVEAATQQLRESNKKLQSLDQAKDEFISMASHQLRTPLTSVKGYISMMMEGDAGPVTDDQKKLLGEAFASSQRMVYLISDLLNVSRLKTGKFIIEKTSINLPKMVEQEVSQLIPAAETRNLVLSYASPTRFPELMLDETKTRQVIMNFIDNAIYYTKSGGRIEVTLLADRNHIEYRVKDTGIGVPARDQHKLFTKFFRARNARSARPDGTGLGLYMAQKIITAQGGSIYFESKEGKGSVFGFNLPLPDENSSIQK